MDGSNNPDVTNDESKQSNNEHKSLDDEKIKVRRQINDLKKIISDIELQLEIITYGEYEIVGKSSLDTNSQSFVPIRQNIKDILRYELFKLSGIHCCKVTEDECLFNFASSNFQSPYAVQIFTQEGTVQLGAWVMPWGITIDRIISETPLQSSKDVIPFLKNCKRSIECHAEREEQFHKLKEFTASIKNVEIDATLGYITILCHFLDVHDNSTNRKFKLTVNMYYGVVRVRPSSITIEWDLKEKLSENIIIKMKTFAKSFKTQNLIDAFKNIREKTHSIYVWKAEEYTDSVLDITDIHYSSESNSNTEISEAENTEYSRKRRKSRRLRKRSKQKSLSNKEATDKASKQMTENSINSQEHENNNGEFSKHVADLKPQRKKHKKKNLSATKSKVQINSKPETENTKSKQTELSFKGIPISSVSIRGNKNIKGRIDEIKMKKTMTSTPMTLRSITHKHQTSINSLEISPITERSTKRTTIETTRSESIARQKTKKNKLIK